MHARNDLVGLARAIIDGDLLAMPALLDWLKEVGDDRLPACRRLIRRLVDDGNRIERRLVEWRLHDEGAEDGARREKYRPWDRFADNFAALFAYELLENEDGRALHRLMEKVGSVEHAVIWKDGGLPLSAGSGGMGTPTDSFTASGDDEAPDRPREVMPDYPQRESPEVNRRFGGVFGGVL
jgi:hypothetical protein